MSYLTKYNASTLDQLMNRITKNTIGMDDYFNRILTYEPTTNYPPYNLVNVDENTSILELALAGFSEDDIKVYTEDGKLTVVGSKETKDDKKYVHHGLASRSFTRSWTLSDETEVETVVFENGLLVVTLKRIVPEKFQRKLLFGSEK